MPSHLIFIGTVVAGAIAAYIAKRVLSAATSNVAVCRKAIPVDPEIKPTSAMKGGHISMGRGAGHIEYLNRYLDERAATASGEEKRRIFAFKALQGREGSTAAINTYDNQIVTWGTGWGGLGGLPGVMDRLIKDSKVKARLKACGVEYLGSGQWAIDDGSGSIVKGKKEALEVIRKTPALLNLLSDLARNPATRDAVTDAQLATFMSGSANVPGSETIATQALFNFAVHLKHWAPGFMAARAPDFPKGVVEEAAGNVGRGLSEERDRLLAPEIVKGFYARARKAGGWVPAWNQMKHYFNDMKKDGLDVTADPVLSASEPPGERVS